MLNQLNPRTREILTKLCQGSAADLGGERIESFAQAERTLLGVLASRLSELEGLRGQDLVEKAMEFLDSAAEQELATDTQADGEGDAVDEEAIPHCSYRLGVIRACSFRGLAPAGREWEFDLAGKSHLLYGPNGCGKSSLLGVITYCLTGCIFRDDQPPDVPRSEKVYSVGGNRAQASARPDALALMDEAGRSSDPDGEYWVEVQLVGEDESGEGRELWIRRHSKAGLTVTANGDAERSIQSLGEVGIADLDAELNLLMPARLPHIRFGKDAEMIQVLSQVIGLDDLEAIADLAGRLVTAARREATRVRREGLAREEGGIAEASAALKKIDGAPVTGLVSYSEAVAESRTLADVETFGKAVKQAIDEAREQLATDLGIEVPSEDSEGFVQFREHLRNLPGQVQSALDELGKPLAQVFPSSLGFETPSEQEIAELEQRLSEFETRAQEQVKERLNWAREERANTKAHLMLRAAKHYPEGSNNCPVCDQDLAEAPGVRKELERLRPLSRCPHLMVQVEDAESRLLNELEGIVSLQRRAEGATALSRRILSDWEAFRESVSKGLLEQVILSFDTALEAASQEFTTEESPVCRPLAQGYAEDFPRAFHRVDEGIAGAKAYLLLCRTVIRSKAALGGALAKVLTAEQRKDVDDSLKVVLERGRATNEAIGTLTTAHTLTGDLYKSVKARDTLLEKIKKYEAWGEVGERVKSLGRGVRSEVMRMVESLDVKMKAYYAQLYDNEILELRMLTTGHPANPHVKDEINAYLRAGRQLVPMGPFSNAGRFRALVLSFVFALLDESTGTLSMIVLDDPAVSLDDEHKARLVNRIIGPTLESKQVLLATHYESFHRLAERAFVGRENLCMVPRRDACDEVAFEPGDILRRVDGAIRRNRGSWRDQAGSLRRWIERSLRTLSGYCPQRFWQYNDLVGTVDAYRKIDDPRVVTLERNEICRILSRSFIEDVRRLAHDDDAEYSEFEAQLSTLKTCRKHVEKEIERFKTIYEEELAALRLADAPTVRILSLPNAIPPWSLEVVREAAAAHNGQGIEWDENELHSFDGHQIAIATANVGSPVVLRGQRMLLDSQGQTPRDDDLVAIETADGKRYFRRFWKGHDGSLLMEALNPTKPRRPVQVLRGAHNLRRVVGVLFDKVALGDVSKTDEWVPGQLPDGLLDDIVGLRIKGTSMEPIVRDSQIVLVRKGDDRKVEKGDLGCVDVADGGTVIKRCYPSEDEWLLCSVNLTDLEDPMRVKSDDILHAYPLIGVMFELESCA